MSHLLILFSEPPLQWRCIQRIKKAVDNGVLCPTIIIKLILKLKLGDI
jgi:hypothetical protein